MSNIEIFITVVLCALGTMTTRFLPFLVFSSDKPTPKYVQYLGKALPAAIFVMLLVYCLKGVNPLTGSHGLPEFLAIALTAALQLVTRQVLLSIGVGTLFYMGLVQFVF